MFGLGKKKVTAIDLADILMKSMLGLDVIKFETEILIAELSEYSNLIKDKKNLLKKYWLLLKCQLIFGAISKSTDGKNYDNVKNTLIEKIQWTYDIRFNEESGSEFSPFRRYQTSYSKLDIHEVINSLSVDLLLNLGISELTQNSLTSGEVGLILNRKISHHLIAINKAIIDSIKII